MIPDQQLPHRAHLDADGNIVIPDHDRVCVPEEMICKDPVETPEVITDVLEEDVWYLPEIEEGPDHNASRVHDADSWSANDDSDQTRIAADANQTTRRETREKLYQILNEFLSEGVRQYGSSFKTGKIIGGETAGVSVSAFRSLWNFLTQPVWVPDRKKRPKQYSRGTLFVIDTIRFGGTFATIFVLLFVTLNYQSFWAIAHSYVDPLAKVTTVNEVRNDAEENIADKLKRIPSLAVSGQDGSMLDYLPQVGPPDNRLVIPKLNLNVPIVVPPNDALLREDWKSLEENIQMSLQDGVVHYPGTAKPGQAGNFFVTGHSSYFPWAKGEYKSVFARLSELKTGDEYWVFYGGDRFRYVIEGKKEIKPSDVTVLDQPVSKRIGTLMTCTPVGTTLRRLIINAREVDPLTGDTLEIGERRHVDDTLPRVQTELLPI